MPNHVNYNTNIWDKKNANNSMAQLRSTGHKQYIMTTAFCTQQLLIDKVKRTENKSFGNLSWSAVWYIQAREKGSN